MQVEFGPLVMVDPLLTIDDIARRLILLALFVLVFHVIEMFIRYRKLRQWAKVLSAPLQIYIETGNWEPAEISSWPEIKDPKFLALVEALRRELPGRGPLSSLAAINQGLDLLTGPYIRMTYRMRVSGWGICLVGLFSGLWAMHSIFLGMQFYADPRNSETFWRILSRGLADAIEVPTIGLAVGLAFFIASGIARSLLGFIHQDLSNRILAASIKKAD